MDFAVVRVGIISMHYLVSQVVNFLCNFRIILHMNSDQYLKVNQNSLFGSEFDI